ncbi:Multisubstrate pseudouridine synthase [Lachnellula occidentalis]|uniref:Multisubstrate pseudouridine synthase n=1 Tax=Lachnellula occidentalis TaxID=215460 RepID=A0A8H8RJ92_9HELO|nr:Multisubstrate pseudouridine synthase [Lachnellula occidentalis]
MPFKPDNITVSTIASAKTTESTVTTTSAQATQATRKWHFDLASTPHRYAWDAATSKQAHPLPLKDGSSSVQDLQAREAEKPPHSRHRAGTAEHKTTSTLPEQHPRTDYSAYPPRNDSLGKKAAARTRALRATTLPSREADPLFPDLRPTYVDRTQRPHKDLGSVSGKGDGHKPMRMALLSVEDDSEPSSARVIDKITHPNMLHDYFSMPVKDSPASTSYPSTDNDNSEFKVSSPQGHREPLTFDSVVDEVFRLRGKTPGRLVVQGSSTDSGETQVKDSWNRHPATLVTRVEGFLKSNGKIKNHPWFKKRARRLELRSVSMKHPNNLQDSESKAGSGWKHTGNTEVQISRRRKLRRTQSFSDLRHNVKSDGRNGDNEIPRTRSSQIRRDNLKVTHPDHHMHHLTSSNIESPIQTQWEILRTTAPMDIKGTSSTESTPSLFPVAYSAPLMNGSPSASMSSLGDMEDTTDILALFDDTRDEVDGSHDVLALVNHLRLELQTPLSKKLQAIGKLLKFLLAGEEMPETSTSFETIINTRLDKLVEQTIDWKVRHKYIPDHKESRKVKALLMNDIIPTAEVLQMKWQLRWGKSYFNLDTLRRQMLGIDGALRDVFLNTGKRIGGYRWELMQPNNNAKQFGCVGFEPGDWWLNMECACRDGIISSPYDVATRTDAGEGKYALVLATGREEPGPSPGLYMYTREGGRKDMAYALLTQFGRPIRLLRSYTLDSPHAPAVGLRYDGLHYIDTYKKKSIDFDGNLHVLTLILRRADSQKPLAELQRFSPTPSQQDDWKLYEEILKEDYRSQNEDPQIYAVREKLQEIERKRRAEKQQKKAVLKYLDRYKISELKMSVGEAATEPPRKRQKLSPTPTPTPNTTTTTTDGKKANMDHKPSRLDVVGETSDGKEAEVGILHFVNASNPGFSGVLKQRYTDFLVHEIALDGTVIHLTDDQAPKVNNDARKAPEVQSAKPVPEAAKATAPAAEENEVKPVPEVSKENVAPQPSSDVKSEAGALTQPPSANGTPGELFTSTENRDRIKPEEFQILIDYFGHDLTEKIFKMYQSILAKPGAKASTFGTIQTEPITDKDIRGRIHGDIRRIFNSKLETEMINEGKILISASRGAMSQNGRYQNPRNQARGGQPQGKVGWEELGGEHLHFTLEKKNKDTMEVLGYLARAMKMKPKEFTFAGTKDRRAVTVQRVSVFRRHARELVKHNSSLRDARIGNFEYKKNRLELGELGGNQFTITLRDCQFPNEAGLDEEARLELGRTLVGDAVKYLQANGFINYFGLQRFGTFGIGTHQVGMKILKEDFEGAVWDILSYTDETLSMGLYPEEHPEPLNRTNRDDVDRALAINSFKKGGKSQDALRRLPKKFHGEASLIQALAGHHKSDFAGALLQITRGLRTMYVHAYQSYIWNMAASIRWAKYGTKVIAGDLVLVDTPAQIASAAKDEVDENGEVVVRPAADDTAVTHDDLYQRARPLTAEEAESGKYTIFDIILPTPGFDIEYPANDIGDFYKEFMGSELGGGLDPANMRRKHKDFSLSGSYRPLMAKVGQDLSFEVSAYRSETEQLVETDTEKLDKLRPKKAGWNNSNRDNNANNRENKPWASRGQFNDSRGGPSNGRGNNWSTGQGRNNFTGKPEEANQGSSALNAWNALPSKLQAEEKAAAEVYEAQKLITKPVDPNTVAQPSIKDTFTETTPGDWTKKTGNKTTVVHAAQNQSSKDEKHDAGIPSFDGASDSKPGSPARKVKNPFKKLDKRNSTNDLTASGANDDTLSETEINPQEAGMIPSLAQSSVESSVTATKGYKLNQAEHPGQHVVSTSSISDTSDGGVRLSGHSDELDKKAASVLRPDAKEFNIKEGNTKESTSMQASAEEFAPKQEQDVEMLDSAEPSSKRPAEEITQEQEQEAEQARIAVVVSFALGSSQYATMALRELMKAGGVKNYTPEFSSAR